MYQLAIELIRHRYSVGWGGAAVIRTEEDHYFTSLALETANGSAQLCIEVGAIVLSPCGICQERLRFLGAAYSANELEHFLKRDYAN